MARLFVIISLCLTVGCSNNSQNASGDADSKVFLDTATLDGVSDVLEEVGLEVIPTDARGETVVPPAPRKLKFRAIGGMSMGAGALNFHAHNPGLVDVVAALGGYVNYSYVIDMVHRQVFGGFCPRETLLAHLEDLNDPDAPGLQCAVLETMFPWEFPQNFNAIHPDYSGGTWHRDTYLDSIGALTTAFGNLFSYNPENPILPPGVPVEWLQDEPDKCANPAIVGKPHNYNAEYNPNGEYSLITFCDGEEPIPGGKDNPDYWALLGAYDPTLPHTRPVTMILAVDYNGNGLRDYHEPLVINARERWTDTGTDGCANADEDGSGGCGGGGSGEDPNGDDFDTFDNPGGTEGDNIWQAGEVFDDLGLDGVADTDDFGEGDGEYSVSPHLEALFSTTGMAWIANASTEELLETDVFLDAGVRDGLQSLTGTYRIGSALALRGQEVSIYENFTGTQKSVYPSDKEWALNEVYEKVDWSPESIGRNFIVKYGFEDATPEQIAMGDGKHVGTAEQLFNRVAMFVYNALARWPELDTEACPGSPGKIFPSSFYSAALGSRFGCSVALPPCYDESDATYPVIYFLPGQGMWAADVTVTYFILSFTMQSGVLPKFIEVAPEGQCCRIHKETGERYCACLNSDEDGSMMDCVAPQCQKAHADCEMLQIPKAELYQECDGGCVFANQVSDQFGNVEPAARMLYEDMLLDLMDHVESTYRVRPPQE